MRRLTVAGGTAAVGRMATVEVFCSQTGVECENVASHVVWVWRPSRTQACGATLNILDYYTQQSTKSVYSLYVTARQPAEKRFFLCQY